MYISLIAAVAMTFAGEWPQFRGPNAAGVATEGGLPVVFGPAKNEVWKTALPAGKSSPVLTADRIFLTAAEGDQLQTLALDRKTGRILWRRAVKAERSEILHKLNDPASPSPATDGINVYAFFGNFGLISYGPDGNERWRMPLGPFTNLHGMGASPVLSTGKVLLVCDQDVGSFVIAVNQRDGQVVWKTPRDVTHGYSTPVVHGGELIIPGAYQMIAYSIETGEKVWWAGGLTWQPKSAPVIGDGVLYFNGWAPGGDAQQQYDLPSWEQALKECDANGDGKLTRAELPKPYQPPGAWDTIDLDNDDFLNERDWVFFRARRASRNSLMAIRLGGRGDVTGTHVLWRQQKGIPDVPCPLLYNGVLYLVKTGGIASTVDAASGTILKQARLEGALDGYYSSPVGADGKVYMSSESGKVVVVKAAPQWEILAINDFEEPIYATPAIHAGKIYLRTRSALYAFAGAEK